MSLQKAQNHLKKYNADNRILEFKESSATVTEAAKAIGCTEGEIAKSLSFQVENSSIIIIVAGDKKIDNRKYKDEFNCKAKMIPFEEVERKIGHIPGGVCPFGINEGIKVYLDKSLKEYKYVYPACGTPNSAIKLTIEELEKFSNFDKWVNISK